MNAAEIYGFLVSQSTHLAVLFFVIWGLVALCHGKSAHLRYLLWAVILVKCLLPPVFTIPVAVLPGPVVTSPVVESPEGPAERRVLQTANSPLPPVVEPVVTTSVDLSTMTPAPVIEPQVPDRAPWWRTLDTQQRVLLVWGAGVVVIFLGTCVRALRFARILRRSRVEIDDVLAQKIRDLSQRFRPGLTVKAYQLEGTGQPFVWGIFKGDIYLPANFCQTSTEHKRCSVLLHELAHVARLDPLVNLIQIVTQALYWFHPLVWVANKKIRAEREKCCDEIAIARFDTTPKEYGSAIVDTLTQEYESRMAVPTLAVAGPIKNIEDRIKTIMMPGKQFYSRPTFKVCMIVLVLAVTLTPMAVALMPRSIDAMEPSSKGKIRTSQYSARFSNGFAVELVGICEYPSQGKPWWGPDGTPLNLNVKTQDKSHYTSKNPGYEFVFRKSGDASFKIDSVKGCNIKSWLDVTEPVGLHAYRVHIHSQHKTTDVTLAMPTDEWKTVHASNASNASTSATVRGKTIILGAMISAGEDSIVSSTDELGYEKATRIIVTDSSGQEHLGKTLTDTGIKDVRQRTLRYENLALTDVAEVRFQVCEYEYCHFRNVSLQPRTKAGVLQPKSVVESKPGTSVIGVIKSNGTGQGEVTATHGDAILGNNLQYTEKLYHGRLRQGDKIELVDNQVITNQLGIPIIKIKSVAGSPTVSAGTIGWIQLTSTSFAGYFVIKRDSDRNVTSKQDIPVQNPSKTLQSLFMAGRMLCQSIQEALEVDDFETALALCQQLEPHVDQGLKLADKVDEGAMFKALATQFQLWHEVIKQRDKARALKMGEMLNQMGGNMAPQVEGMVTAPKVGSSDSKEGPLPVTPLSYEDRRELVRLTSVYARVAFSKDMHGAETIFNFESEGQKQRVLDMMRQDKTGLSSGDKEAQPVYVVQIDPTVGNRALVSALCPLGGRYIAHSVSWVKTDGQWKVDMDLAKMMDTQEQVKTMGAEAYGRLQLKTQLESWESAQGPDLVSLYASASTQARFHVQATQFAKMRGLPMRAGMTEAQNQEHLEKIRGKSPEDFRYDMIAKLRRQLGPAEKYGKLEFRMLYDTVASEELQEFRDHFKRLGPSGSLADPSPYIWLPMQSRLNLPDAVIEEYQGQQYVLVSNQPEQIMMADGSWGILAVSPQADGMGRRAIGLEMDRPGGEKLRQITSHNLERAMAIVLDGQVLSAPTIKSAIGRHVIITGKFTEPEVRDMMVSLQKGMRPKSVGTPSVKTEN
ncbi:MAG: hypothetical protein HQ515_19030 [Phycisphaeraceae bacterium]|nr:hypothetical protein [Phycisphaeraceae bacterium]